MRGGLTGTLAVPAAGAASTDTTLRVGLTVGGASSFATPMLENVSGESTGYTVGTVSGTTFQERRFAGSALTIRLNDKNAFEVCDTETGKVLFTSAEGLEQLAIRPNSRLTWFKGYKVVRRFCLSPRLERKHHRYKLCECRGLCEGRAAV